MTTRRLVFSLLPGFFAVCRLEAAEGVPGWVGSAPFTSITRTAEELSVVCPEENLPAGVASERGWRCLKVEGPFAFSVVGIVAAFASPLAREGISVFIVSTFDTDYLMVKVDALEKTVLALSGEGHHVLLEA